MEDLAGPDQRGGLSDAAAAELAAADAARARADRIAEAAVCGDAHALNELWNSNRRWVAAILLAHKPRWADVEDLLQEVAMSMVRKVGEVRDPKAVRPWLRTVAINVAHAAARSGKRRESDERMGGAEGTEDAFEGRGRDHEAAPESLAEYEQGRLLMQLAEQLPDGYREPLLLKAIHDLSYREIGEILDLPETTIETRIARGRRQLRELAAAREREEEDRRLGLGSAGRV
ncbi:MAG: sigma-70 family RNA polymerase sigma factor [Planctomycetes bacterium]|nr:sigma-70 family RNA polymerase sigma factor [Planctomycetota bacterium]